MTSAIDQLVARMYHASPPGAHLYHYTSLKAMQGIVADRGLWATDIRYMSDASELRYLMERLRATIMGRGGTASDEILRQFQVWIAHRLPEGNMVFAASFSEKGNLLSQWRAYCPPAQGVSLGFSSTAIVQAAQREDFTVGKCVYDYEQQQAIVDQILDDVVSLAAAVGPDPSRHPSQSYDSVFEAVETPLLRIGALFKYPAFAEEAEWRAVSKVMARYVDTGIHYRQGPSMLVPYIPFRLADTDRPLPLGEIFVGPTPHPNLAVSSVSRFLADNRTSLIVRASSIPYRTW